MDDFLINPPGGGAWNLVGYQNVTGVASVSFTGLPVSTRFWKLFFKCERSDPAAYLWLRFNGDAGLNYTATSHEHGYWSGANQHAQSTQVAAGQIRLLTFTDKQTGEIYFCTVKGDSTQAMVLAKTFVWMATTAFMRQDIGGFYNGAADVSRIDLLVDTGTLSGHFALLECEY